MFCPPDSAEQDAAWSQPIGRRAAVSPRRASRRVGPRPPARQANPGRVTAKARPHDDTGDLLAITPERLRQALWRSFLRYGIPGDLDSAVHAAMNVTEPVLQARDAEILRLRGLAAVKTRASRPSRRT